MLSRIRWQALIALLSTFLVVALVAYAGLNRSTVVVPEKGGTYIEGVAGAPRHINPILGQDNQVDKDLIALVFSGLTKVDDQGRTVADLAQRWEISPDGQIYTFHLRQDVVWQDGAPFTADDVVFTLKAIKDPGYRGSPILVNLWKDVAVEKVDTHAVRFVLPEAFAPFLDYTSIGILPAHVLGGIRPEELPDHSFNLRPLGTGRFQVQEVTINSIGLVANPSYYGPKPYLEGLKLQFYPDWASVLTAYRQKEVEGIGMVLPQDLAEVRKESTLNLYSGRVSRCAVLFLNLKNSPFQDVEVRRALLMALDRQALIGEALGGQAVVVHSPILAPSWAYHDGVRTYDYNPETAKALLEARGWRDSDGDGIREKDGEKLEFNLLTNDDPVRMRAVSIISQVLAKVGVKANPQVARPGSLVPECLRPRSFDALLYEWWTTLPDPDPYPMWHSTQTTDEGQNFAGYENREVDQLLEEARRTTDQELRRRLYYRFQDIFAEEVPSLLLYSQVYGYGVDDAVGGVQLGLILDPSDRFRNIEEWFVKTKRQETQPAR